MAASIRKSKIAQNELRKFMKEGKNNKKANSSKIDSPLAKYNDLKQLICVICNSQVKSEALWSAHIRGRSHKENIEKLKRNEKSTKKQESFKQPLDVPKEPPAKRLKAEESEYIKDDSKFAVPSDDNTDGVENEISNATETEANNSNLPADFFDASVSKNTEKDVSTEASHSESTIVNNAKDLPEGFFDDPVVDAKVRKIEYKDPMDEEWDKFQKIISTESSVSQAIMDEDIEESKAEREIDEIDEQMHNWKRVQALQEMKEKIQYNSNEAKSKDSSDGSSSAEEDFEEFLDWRSKRVK